MVETFFRSAGWRVRRGGEDFLDVLSSNWFDVVGFSLSAGRHVDSLCAAVAKGEGRLPQQFNFRDGRGADFF